MKRTYRRTGN